MPCITSWGSVSWPQRVNGEVENRHEHMIFGCRINHEVVGGSEGEQLVGKP